MSGSTGTRSIDVTILKDGNDGRAQVFGVSKIGKLWLLIHLEGFRSTEVHIDQLDLPRFVDKLRDRSLKVFIG